MTPKRKKYLANCSEREKGLRCNINQAKINLAVLKLAATTQGMLPILKNAIKSTKCMLVVYRHELHRLKGMDRVVVPKVVSYKEFEGVCKCGNDVTDFDFYCSECGRKILWEKVRE